jgi:hypothetical protein
MHVKASALHACGPHLHTTFHKAVCYIYLISLPSTAQNVVSYHRYKLQFHNSYKWISASSKGLCRICEGFVFVSHDSAADAIVTR